MGLDAHNRQNFKARLLEERRRLLRSLEALASSGWLDAETGGIGELSSYDQHPADLGSELAARQVDLGLQQNTRRLLAQVDRALERLEEGSYGICEECGRPIPMGRLLAVPYATKCTACAVASEGDGAAAGEGGATAAREGPPGSLRRRRPPEEELLSPPFGRCSRSGPAYDGADAWRELARYGTSNSPQDAPEEMED
ncbi:MAG: hypothetical protein BAA04_05315 [Firmicutes bacterium ZCTH02-B6]|nr:MAG: hypothetical protein BAA04_05315 [Firmicutes bacterium ZCTH02-B6]